MINNWNTFGLKIKKLLLDVFERVTELLVRAALEQVCVEDSLLFILVSQSNPEAHIVPIPFSTRRHHSAILFHKHNIYTKQLSLYNATAVHIHKRVR